MAQPRSAFLFQRTSCHCGVGQLSLFAGAYGPVLYDCLVSSAAPREAGISSATAALGCRVCQRSRAVVLLAHGGERRAAQMRDAVGCASLHIVLAVLAAVPAVLVALRHRPYRTGAVNGFVALNSALTALRWKRRSR